MMISELNHEKYPSQPPFKGRGLIWVYYAICSEEKCPLFEEGVGEDVILS
jgi:hypothetical protein